jgi:hypothetical protein
MLEPIITEGVASLYRLSFHVSSAVEKAFIAEVRHWAHMVPKICQLAGR